MTPKVLFLFVLVCGSLQMFGKNEQNTSQNNISDLSSSGR